VTTGRDVRIEHPDGTGETARALGVDAASGGLVVAGRDGAERTLVVGEVLHVRLSEPRTVGV
jgi:hypothetical protein